MLHYHREFSTATDCAINFKIYFEDKCVDIGYVCIDVCTNTHSIKHEDLPLQIMCPVNFQGSRKKILPSFLYMVYPLVNPSFSKRDNATRIRTRGSVKANRTRDLRPLKVRDSLDDIYSTGVKE